MADTKISALSQFNPAGSDLVAAVNLAGPTTEAVRVDALGGLILLEEHTAVAAATIDFTTRNVGNWSGATFQSDFDTYFFTLHNIVPGTTSVQFNALFSVNGGVSWDTSALYAASILVFNATGIAETGQAIGSPTTALELSQGTNVPSGGTRGIVGHYYLFSPSSTAFFKEIIGELLYNAAGSTLQKLNFGGEYQSLSAVNAMRFLMSAGTLSGTMRCYGIRK